MPIGIEMNNYDISMGIGMLRFVPGGGITGNVYLNGNVGIRTTTPTVALDVTGAITSSGIIKTTITTASSTTTSGALQVAGGAGIVGNVIVGGIIDTTNTTASSNTTSGALQVGGGAGIVGNVIVGGIIDTINTTASSNTTSGALQVGGGAGIVGNVYAGGIIKTTATTVSSNTTSGALQVGGGAGIVGALNVGGIIETTNTTASSNTTSGALQVGGGAGIVGQINAGSINSTGNIGIGTTTPTQALDVVGSIRLTGSLRQVGFTRIVDTRPLLIMQLSDSAGDGYRYNLNTGIPGQSLGGTYNNLFNTFEAAQAGATRQYRLKVIIADTASFTYTIRLARSDNAAIFNDYTFASATGSFGQSTLKYSSASTFTAPLHVTGTIYASGSFTGDIYYVELQALDVF